MFPGQLLGTSLSARGGRTLEETLPLGKSGFPPRLSRYHHPNVVAESLQAIENCVHRFGLKRDRPNDVAGKLELSAAHKIQEHRDLARKMVGDADHFSFFVEDLCKTVRCRCGSVRTR